MVMDLNINQQMVDSILDNKIILGFNKRKILFQNMRSIQKKKIFLIENGEGVENMVNIKK